MPDQEMIDRCKVQLAEVFLPAINPKAPYAKIMFDMAIKEIIKAMREPTEKMIEAGDDALIEFNSSSQQAWTAMLDCILND